MSIKGVFLYHLPRPCKGILRILHMAQVMSKTFTSVSKVRSWLMENSTLWHAQASMFFRLRLNQELCYTASSIARWHLESYTEYYPCLLSLRLKFSTDKCENDHNAGEIKKIKACLLVLDGEVLINVSYVYQTCKILVSNLCRSAVVYLELNLYTSMCDILSYLSYRHR